MALSKSPDGGCQDHTLTEASVMALTNRHRLRHRPIQSSSSLPQLWLCGSRKGWRACFSSRHRQVQAPWDLARPRSSQEATRCLGARACGAALPIGDRLCGLGRVFSGRYCWTKTLSTKQLGETKSRSLKPRLIAVSWRTVRLATDAEWFGSDGSLLYPFLFIPS